MDEEQKQEELEETPVDTQETAELDNSQSVPEEEPEIEEVDDASIPTVDDYNKKVQETRELQARAKRAEQRLKELEGKVNQKPLTNNELTREEVVLIAKGVPEEEIAYLKKLQAGAKAMGENVPLTKLYDEDPGAIALREKRQAEQRSKNASLGPSKGKSTLESKIDQPGLSSDEHRKLWEKAMQG